MRKIILLFISFTTVQSFYTFMKIRDENQSIKSEISANRTGKRNELLEKEMLMSLGGKINLDYKEMRLNNILMQWKLKEMDYAFENPQYFNFTYNFAKYKDTVKDSKVYQFIREMPKGANLHVHASGMLGPDHILKFTYNDYLYVCFEDTIKFKFSSKPPSDECVTQWLLMSNVRKSLHNATKFDEELRKNFTLLSTCQEEHTDVNTIWNSFSKIFHIIYPLLGYKPVWEEYLYEALKELRNDNVMYVEIRSGYTGFYDLNGRMSDAFDFVNTSKRVVDRFVEDYPDFLGAKLIYSQGRHVDRATVEDALTLTRDLKKAFPDFIAGFDLVGQEDLGAPIVEFLSELDASNDLNYFFHAGETNWYGTLSDENLVDAAILGAKRIGHAYALVKHPLVKELIKKNDICLEVNVISNSVLSLVSDLRNHPLASFIAEGLPVVLSSDDPGLWEAYPLSTDFYATFIGVASRLQDLRLLKQLALNSLQYSSLEEIKKKEAFEKFEAKWDEFVKKTLSIA